MFGRLFAELGVRGKVAVYGHVDQGVAHALLDAVEELNPAVQIVGEYNDSIFQLATATKDTAEVKRIRAVGKRTVAVVGETAEFLTSHRAQDGYLVRKDGARLTLGEVKTFINRRLLEHGVVDAEAGTIFAQGRDAGVPHSRGEARQAVALGKSLVFDIFPAEPGGGYFFDFTRTWCLGYAPDHVHAAYEQVAEIYRQTLKALKPGAPCRDYQTLVCDYFEARGHATIRTNPATTDGYVHSLGHGVGLYIHEAPSLSDRAGNAAVLQPGHVLTVEPGLYYPDHPQGGFGVRIEDTLWLNPRTLRFEILARYPYDLVLPIKEAKSQGSRVKVQGKRPKAKRSR
jgi:Xaa-Pro aminopeptidase